jgi:hypothetical protein
MTKLDRMPVEPKRSDRDPRDDAAARRWAEETRREGEVGKLADDSEYLARKLAEEKRKLKRR